MATIGRPNIGAYTGIPDIGAWQFIIPDGLRVGTLHSDPVLANTVEATAALIGRLGNRIIAEGELSANQQ